MSWNTHADFLRDLDNYAEYTRPKIDENGEVICDTPMPDTLRMFFDENADKISCKEMLKAKEQEEDSDKDVDESSFEKRDEPKDSCRKATETGRRKAQEDEDRKESHEAPRFVPQRGPQWAKWPANPLLSYKKPEQKHRNVREEVDDEEFYEAPGFVPQRTAFQGAKGPSNPLPKTTANPKNKQPWTGRRTYKNSRGSGHQNGPTSSKTVFVPAGMSIDPPNSRRPH